MNSEDQYRPDWLDVSRETGDRLDALCALVKKWTPTVNLVAKSTVPDMWLRHVLDSAQLFYLAPSKTRRWIDLGSGAGFPGLVIAALAKETRPDLKVTLIESDQRKAAFLVEAARTMEVSVKVLRSRVEAADPQAADVVSARAFSSLDGLCRCAKLHLCEGGVAIFPKGSNVGGEIEVARAHWTFSMNIHQSKTDSTASVLVLRDIQHD